MTPTEALRLVEAHPLTLSTGQSLVDWLILKRLYPPHDALRAREEYQRFLALALTAPEGQATLPGPHIAQLWQTHRADTAAYAAFTTALGSDKLTHTHPRRSLALDPAWAETRARYRAAFGSPPALWWPSPDVIWLQFSLLLIVALLVTLTAGSWIGGQSVSGLHVAMMIAPLSLYLCISGYDHLYITPFALLRPTLSPSAAP